MHACTNTNIHHHHQQHKTCQVTPSQTLETLKIYDGNRMVANLLDNTMAVASNLLTAAQSLSPSPRINYRMFVSSHTPRPRTLSRRQVTVTTLPPATALTPESCCCCRGRPATLTCFVVIRATLRALGLPDELSVLDISIYNVCACTRLYAQH